MTQEAFELIQKMDTGKGNIELQLAIQCAPLIAGLKISNLLILQDYYERLVGAVLKSTRISYYRLLKNREKTAFLLFDRKKLEEFLHQEEVEETFVQKGYQQFWLGGILRAFQIRYQAYMDGMAGFPHEMGLLLGYPVEDVKGFVENEGKNFLYAGYWKVYGHAAEKKQLFYKFEAAREALVRLVSSGVKISEILTCTYLNFPAQGCVLQNSFV